MATCDVITTSDYSGPLIPLVIYPWYGQLAPYGLDGWIYANHGFNNQSKVAGQDGHTVTLISGNVFRFRPDGSRVETLHSGQVNPFGSDEDEFGTYFTADCHSKPISQLIRGGCYPSFGRPDDVLGFVPSTMEHLHGSTAIGIAIGKGSGFPSSFQENFLVET